MKNIIFKMSQGEVEREEGGGGGGEDCLQMLKNEGGYGGEAFQDRLTRWLVFGFTVADTKNGDCEINKIYIPCLVSLESP